MAGGGGDGDVVPVSPRAQQPSRGSRRGHHQKAAWLPLDIIVAEIAARSDPATLVRCAATCRDARRRIAEDPSLLLGRLRLRDTERFVLPLLRGHLTEITTDSVGGEKARDVYMVDTTGAGVKVAFAKADETVRSVVPLDSRGGLILIRAKTCQDNTHLFVCNPATRRLQALPPEPAFPYGAGWRSWSTDWSMCGELQYILLVGGSSDGEGAASANDAAVGRPFQVLVAKLVLSLNRRHRRLLVHIFSSDHGAWSPLTEIPTLNLLGSGGYQSSRALVVGDDVVHWLCQTDSGSYMLVLRVGVARVNVTSLPARFPRDDRHHYLLATATAGGNPVMLVADKDKISAWEQSKHTRMWKPQPQVVIENETILGFKGVAKLVGTERTTSVPKLLWFGERSGVVLLRIHSCCLLWLDLQSKKIVKCFSDWRMQSAQVCCPYEVDLSSWEPTFSSSAITL